MDPTVVRGGAIRTKPRDGQSQNLHLTTRSLSFKNKRSRRRRGRILPLLQGAVRAEFMHRRIHEVPHTGGVSSYRKSWFDKNVLEDARLKLNALGWQGVGMFEYRWDASNGEFYLMELNGRFWGSLHLALFAGVDFPALLVACHLGRDSKVVRQWNDVSSRYTFPREIEYVLSVLKDPKVPSSRKLRAVGEFFWLGFDPRVRGDLLYAGDGSLYWRTVMRTARTQLASLREKLAPTKGT